MTSGRRDPLPRGRVAAARVGISDTLFTPDPRLEHARALTLAPLECAVQSHQKTKNKTIKKILDLQMCSDHSRPSSTLSYRLPPSLVLSFPCGCPRPLHRHPPPVASTAVIRAAIAEKIVAAKVAAVLVKLVYAPVVGGPQMPYDAILVLSRPLLQP